MKCKTHGGHHPPPTTYPQLVSTASALRRRKNMSPNSNIPTEKIQSVSFKMITGIRAMSKARVLYEKYTAEIAGIISNGNNIDFVGFQKGNREWITPLLSMLDGEENKRKAQDAVSEAEQLEESLRRWLAIMSNSNALLSMATIMMENRWSCTMSCNDFEAAWDAWNRLNHRLPSCGHFLTLDELEDENVSSDVDETYDPNEDCDVSSNGPEPWECHSSDEEGLEGSWNSDRVSSEDEETYDPSEDCDVSSDEEAGLEGCWDSDHLSSEDEEEEQEQDEVVGTVAGAQEEEQDKKKNDQRTPCQGGPAGAEHHAISLRPETVERLKENLSARGFTSDGTHDGIVQRLLDAMPAAAVATAEAPLVDENARRAEPDGVGAKMSVGVQGSGNGSTDTKGKGRKKRGSSALSRRPLAPIVNAKVVATAAAVTGKRARRK